MAAGLGHLYTTGKPRLPKVFSGKHDTGITFPRKHWKCSIKVNCDYSHCMSQNRKSNEQLDTSEQTIRHRGSQKKTASKNKPFEFTAARTKLPCEHIVGQAKVWAFHGECPVNTCEDQWDLVLFLSGFDKAASEGARDATTILADDSVCCNTPMQMSSQNGQDRCGILILDISIKRRKIEGAWKHVSL